MAGSRGGQALMFGKEVRYVTERAAFRQISAGLGHTELAPGVDPHHEVLSRMEYRPGGRGPEEDGSCPVQAGAPAAVQDAE